jgi:hypothetical protein
MRARNTWYRAFGGVGKERERTPTAIVIDVMGGGDGSLQRDSSGWPRECCAKTSRLPSLTISEQKEPP